MRRFMAAGAVVLAAAVTACGGSNGDDAGKSAAATNGVQACTKKAETMRDDRRAEVPLTVGAAFDMSKNAGKSVWVVNAARVPFLQGISDGAEAAAKAAGMTAKVVYGDGTTNSAQAAVQQAVAQKADAIVLVVVDPATIKSAVSAAKKANITVVDAINRADGASLPAGLAGQQVVNVKADMEGTVGWILADSKCAGETIMYSPSALPITSEASEIAKRVSGELCPDCSFEVKDMNYGTFANTLAPEVQTDIRRKPDTGYIFSIVGSAVPYVDAGLRGTGSKVKILAHDGLADNLEAMRKGDTQLAVDVAFAPAPAIGWAIVDQVGRLMTGDDSASNVVMPSRLVDKTNVGASDEDIWPGYDGYEQKYQSAWQS